MPMRSLLLSRDDEVIRVLRRVLDDMQIEVEVCTGSERAAEQLVRRKYDAVIVDCDDLKGAADVLQNLRKTPSNKTSTAFAIVNGATSVHRAFEMGANLALEKPITADRARRSFRAAHGLMLQERRRYYRHPVDMTVTLRFENGNGKQEFHGSANNLSEGGMAIKLKNSVQDKTGLATLQFVLPGTRNWIEAHGRIAWADGEGQAGLRFENLPFILKEQLEKWFTENAEGGKPAALPAKAPQPKRRFFF
jgi:CheY-like chemotaxis protein